LLRVVQPIAIGILRADQHCAGRSRRCDALTGDRAVDSKHINVVAQNLKIVAGVILREQSFIVKHGFARVSGHLQMAAEARGRPRSVAGIASHAAVRVSERGVVVRHLRSHRASLFIILVRRDFSLKCTLPGVMLSMVWTISHSLFSSDIERWNILPSRDSNRRTPRAFAGHRDGGRHPRRRAGRDQCGLLANRTVAIDAVDFDGGARLAVDFPVAVIVLREMAVVALHSLLEMDVGEVDGFAETVGIVERNLLAFLSSQFPCDRG